MTGIGAVGQQILSLYRANSEVFDAESFIFSEWPIDLADPIVYHKPHGEYRCQAELWANELVDFPRGISE
jgi:hypothetical protein